MVQNSPKNEEIHDVIETVRNQVKAEKKLKCSTDDEHLIRFIKASNCNAQKSFTLIKNYYKAKKENSDEFSFKSPTCYVNVLSRLDLGFLLHEKDPKGRPIVLLKLGDIDPRTESWTQLMQSATITLEALSLEPEFQDSGSVMIFDCTNFSLKLMKWATPHKMGFIMQFLQDCIPLRFEMFHLVNAPLVFNLFFNALKPFMSEEFLNKLLWHKHPFTTLHEHIKPSLLPPTMGGTLDFDKVREWYKFVLSKEEDFKRLNWMGYV